MTHRAAAKLSLLVIAALSAPTFAADYKTEYADKIKASQNVGALGDNLAGDSVNFYTGATSFSATDVSIPGNNSLGVAIGRSYTVETNHQRASIKGNLTTPEIASTVQRAFGDWDLNIPQIRTTMTQAGGWQIDSTTPTPNNRCSVIGQTMMLFSGATQPANGAPPNAAKELGVGSFSFEPSRYWSGYSLDLPGGSQSMLVASLPNNERPSAGGPYHWTTNQNWWFSCIAPNATSGGGEGFLAISPDGTKYTFDKLSKRNVDSINEAVSQNPDGGAPYRTYWLYRAEYLMLPTRIEDRFGNWVQYNWSSDTFARLNSITSSDGRTITLTYNAQGNVGSITDGVRTWTYTYVNGSLTQVSLPDASTWQYSLASLNAIGPPMLMCEPSNPAAPGYECFGDVPDGTDTTGAGGASNAFVVHPSGARVDFTFSHHFQYGSTPQSLWSWPLGMSQKTISGPGIASGTWKYSFFPNRDQAKGACQGGACPTQLITDQIDPDGGISRRIYGVVPNQDQTLLMGELEGRFETTVSSGGTPPIACSPRWGCDILDDPSPGTTTVPVFYKETDYRYVPSAQATPYTVRVGVDPTQMAQTFASERRLPVVTRHITQQGVTFTNQVNSNCTGMPCMTPFAQPTSVTRSSNLPGGATPMTRSETMTYSHNAAKWVVSQPQSVTDVATGKIISRTVYDGTTALPLQTYSFELLQQAMTYNPDGTVATVKDALNHTVTLATWKRGMPQSIAFPNGFAQGAVVNDVGWISSVTDTRAAGDTTTTAYGYDAIGRMNLIDYVNGDTVAWNDTTRGFVPVASVEYGIPAGHWRQTVQTGNGRTTTYYDARWQPVLTRSEDIGNAATVSFVVKRYDSSGRVIFSSYPVATLSTVNDALGGVRSFYDALGRVTKTEQDSELGVLTSTAEYLNGFQTKATNARGKVTTTSYQAFDTPNTDGPIAHSLPAGVNVSIVRDHFGKPKSLTRGGTYSGSPVSVTRSYVYDVQERLCKTVDPEMGATLVDYDAVGNIAWTADGSLLKSLACDRGSVSDADKTARTYDVMNRLLTVIYPDGINNATYEYYADGLLKKLTSGGGVWEYEYNQRRMLKKETLDFYGPYSTTYGYDANGNQSVVTSPNGTAVDYAPNALGQATQAGIYASGVQYHPNGAIKQFTYGNGIVHTMTPNARQLPARSLDSFGGTKFLDDNYSFDANGNTTVIVDNDGNADGHDTSRGMYYDDLDRLTSAIGIWGTASYTYDPMDNLRTSTIGAAGFTYQYDLNSQLYRVDRIGGGAYNYTFDIRGNVSNDGRNTYNFTRGNRLAGVIGKDSYQYDGHGRRMVVWRADGTAQVPVYNLNGQLRYTSDNRLGGAVTPIYLGSSVIAESSWNWATGVSTVTYLHTDSLGSPVARTDASKNVLEKTEYAPYGSPINRPVDGIGYTGHVMDQSSGLVYAQQRYYDPLIGRFLSADSVQPDFDSGTNFNRYWYAENNPYTMVDSDGRIAHNSAGLGPQNENAGGDYSMSTSYSNGAATERKSESALRKEFSKLERAVSKIAVKGDAKDLKKSEMQAALQFAQHAVPFTETFGIEVGANIVVSPGFMLTVDDLTLGSSGGVNVPFNAYTRALVHTHPGRSASFSGTLQFVSGKLTAGQEGDYGIARRDSTDSESRYYAAAYAFAVGGAAMRFDTVKFNRDLREAQKSGKDIRAQSSSYTEKVR